MSRLLAIDPGRNKCGLLLVDIDKGRVLDGKVVLKNDVISAISFWRTNSPFEWLIMGNGTSSEYWTTLLDEFGPIKLVEEKGSTLRARQRYWELWPPTNWIGWLPRGLLIPPEPLDAIAALVLLEDHLGRKFNWPGIPSF